MHGHLLWST